MDAWKKKTPNALTWTRLVGGPIAAWLSYWGRVLPNQTAVVFWTLVVFAALAMTDWFDGFLARRWNAQTRLGAFLDPLADKFLVWPFICVFTADDFFRVLYGNTHGGFAFFVVIFLSIAALDLISIGRRIGLYRAPDSERSLMATAPGKGKTVLLYGFISILLFEVLIAVMVVSAQSVQSSTNPIFAIFYFLNQFVFWFPFLALFSSLVSFIQSLVKLFRAS